MTENIDAEPPVPTRKSPIARMARIGTTATPSRRTRCQGTRTAATSRSASQTTDDHIATGSVI